MSDKDKKPNKWLEKLKNIKHIEIYLAVIFIVIILLVYLSSSKTKDTKKITTNYMSVTAYIENIEQNLEESLSNIAGVSNVKVMITLNMAELEVVDDKVTMTTFPSIRGVLITAKGVNDTSTKLKVLHATQAVIDIKNGNIEILSSE